jgi:hypothetical protein
MLRIAAQDEGSSIAGAFMPDLGSYRIFHSLGHFPASNAADEVGVACSPRFIVGPFCLRFQFLRRL